MTASELADQLAAAGEAVARIARHRTNNDDPSPDTLNATEPDDLAWQYPDPNPGYDDWDDDRTR